MSPHGRAPVEEIRTQVAQILGVGGFADDDDLFDHGLDSLGLIRLVGVWREQGADVTFEDLSSEPTVAAWSRLLSRRSSGPAPAVRPAVTVAEDEPFALATMQYAYWIGRRDEQPLGGVGAHFYTEFDGHDLDPGRLTTALAAIAARHPMLRVRFLDDGRQRIGATAARSGVRVHDLRSHPQDAVARRLEELREYYTCQRLDVEEGHVLDVALTLMDEGRTRLHVDLDMIAADALSLRILLEDLRLAYIGELDPAPLSYTFARYLAERTPRMEAARERARSWWMERLADLPEAPRLPTVIDATDLTPGRSPLARSSRLHHWLPPEEVRALERNARTAGITPAAALATVFAETIGSWSAERRFLLNLPLFDRTPLHPDVERLIGDFSGSVLLDVDVTDSLPFAQRAHQVQADLHTAIDHGAYSGVEVMRDLARASGGRGRPAPVVYTSAIGLGPLFSEAVQECFGRPSWIISQGPQVWLDAQVTELDGGLLLNWDVREAAFAPGVLDAAFTAYRELVAALVADPAAWHRPAAPEAPAEQLAARARRGSGPASPPRPLHESFFVRARHRPDDTALVAADGTRVCYGELADHALRVAGLLAARGVEQGDTVAVTMPRGTDQVAAVLGVLAVGAAYLPLGTSIPSARRARLLARGRAALVLTDTAHLDRATAQGIPAVDVAGATDTAALPRPVRPDPDQTAYVLFTSGSTGEPKGVEMPHRSAAHTVDVLIARLGAGPGDRTLALAELDFDMSIFDLFAPLSSGGAAVLLDDGVRRDAADWARLMHEHRVTLLNCVPALLEMLLAQAESGPGLDAPLRAVLLGGDVIGLDLPDRVRAQAPDCRFLALGGMTEAAVHSTIAEIDRVDPSWHSMPWGVPLPGVRCRVVDETGRDRPDHVPGELWVGGAALAAGYRGDVERTAHSFVTAQGTRWYRSGDRARYRGDATLEFLGRVDDQVKVGGYRIEPGEVEAALCAVPHVAAAIAVVIGGAAPRLAAAVVLASDRIPEPDGLAARAAELLPAYMVPEHIEVWPELPRTPNGKPDRSAAALALTEGAGAAPEADAVPEGAVERDVARVWRDILGAGEIGRTADFFALGGDSLLATRAVAALREAGYPDTRVGELFAAPRLRDFAAGLTPGTGAADPVVRPDPGGRHTPFAPTDVQRAYWIGRNQDFVLGGVGTHHYTEFDGADVDLAGLEKAFDRLVARHDMLRAVFDTDGDQRVLADVGPVRIPVVTATADEADTALAALRTHMSHQILDLTRWPLFDVRAVRYPGKGGTRTRLGVSLDYIVLDALSIMTLYDELGRLYADPDARLAPVELTFRDYLAQAGPDEEDVRRARAYWSERLSELPPAPALPLAVDPAAVDAPRFTRRSTWLGPAEWAAFTDRARALGLTPSALLLACYGEVLSMWSGQSALSLTLTLFNRRDAHPHVDRVLGDFTSLSLTSYDREPGEDLSSAAARLHRRLGRDLDHRDASAVWVLGELARATGLAQTGVPVVFTSSLGVGAGLGYDTDPPFGARVWGLSQSPQVHLDNQVLEADGGLTVHWDAVEQLFPSGVLDAMFDAYRRLLVDFATAAGPKPPGIVLPADQRRAREHANATAGPEPHGLLHDAFFANAEAHPGRTALVDALGETSYAELSERARRVAASLVERGVRPGDAVGVTLPKGADQIAAVLGVLAAGAAYLPIGVDTPPARRDRMFQRAGTGVVVCADPDGVSGGVGMAALLATAPLAEPVRHHPDALAYVIHTSGSTGDPKGVEVTHAAALNTVADVNERFGVGPDDRVLALSALDFDLSVYDVFGLLGAGGALVLPDEGERRDAARWCELVAEHGVTVWNTVPALLDMLLLAGQQRQGFARALRLALVSGDWVGLDLAPRLAEAAERATLVALGGATEAAIWSNFTEVREVPENWSSVPYGLPLRNQRYRVVDPHGRDCPDWVPGELWIGGAGVASGYRGDPVRTAEKFREHAGRRWYRTGDLGRYWPDATLEFLGRTDHQVKIGGHRLELGEVEAALEAHPEVHRAVALTAGGRFARRLHAFAAGPVTPAALAAFLARRLPAHAVPGRIHVLDALPLTANGKVDRAALTELAWAGVQEDSGRPPLPGTEQRLAVLWGDLIGVPVTDRHANFFTLGGTSMLAIRLVTAVRREFDTDVPTRAFLAAPTVAALAAHLAGTAADLETGAL
ncbi:non-ribosomal peptide synthetase [Nocardiopsis ansamitocini]|uniref:Phenyloxazoline synthase MbtB n=1 Tax=Nocardiopsis ansamitocini TaxID=1670832 RepID=A0A9W6P9Q3_9ACTN|nr:non-ribosomal peptide synthetase [Nocardiopsis ansamitocini]GLU50204.1 non-ribosomal peptide synthetase [Nocardiopsis ansamitocini]